MFDRKGGSVFVFPVFNHLLQPLCVLFAAKSVPYKTHEFKKDSAMVAWAEQEMLL